jgi:DNA-directed RNA polymerase specialized sigma24 family protein
MPSDPRRSRFETTRWSVVSAAGRDASAAHVALATLCETYWYPLCAYARRQGHDADDAQDLTQPFFTVLSWRRTSSSARRERGRFRSFLLAAMKHFLLNDVQHRRTLKRGGGQALQSLDVETAETRYRREITDGSTPEALFDRSWACAVLDRVMARLRGECRKSRRIRPF